MSAKRRRRSLLVGAGAAVAAAATAIALLLPAGEDELQLRLLTQDATTITLGWQPQGDRGYVFYTDGRRVSWTADPVRSSVRFLGGAASYRVEAIQQASSGEYPPPPALPSTTSSIEDGDTVIQGATWTITTDPDASLVEFWVDGVKLAEDRTEPYTAALNVAAGQHSIGYCWTIGARVCTGIYGRITVTSSTPPPPPVTTALPTWRVEIPAGGIGYWLFHNSPTTQQVAPLDGNGFRQRVIVWDTAGGTTPALYAGKTFYAVVGFRLITGNPGRLLDWHTQPNDQPYSWKPPDGPPPNGRSSSGVAPLAVDYNGSRGIEFILQPEDWAVDDPGSGNYHYQIFTQTEIEARRGQWVWLWIEIKLGRRDTPPDGALKVWVAGEDTPRVSVANVNTHWWGEHQVNFLQGAYVSTGTPHIVIEHAAARFGRTPREALEDVPIFHSAGATDLSGGPAPGSHMSIAPRLSGEAPIPAPLR